MSLSKKFQILLILFFAFLGSFFVVQNTKAEEAQSPVILNAFQVDYDEYIKIQAEGLISPNNNILIYINQKYDKLANIKKIDDEINKFYYESDLIKKEGVFEIMVIARDKTSLALSAPSIMTVNSIIVKNTANSIETLAENIKKDETLAENLAYFTKKDEILAKNILLEFVDEYPMPAPTLLTPFGKIIDPAKPYISGLAKNDSLIKIFIDHGLESTFLIKNDPSGIGNFAYISKKPLNRGSHLVYATATDNRGKESEWSNIRYFSKYKPRLTATNTVEKAISGKISAASATSTNMEGLLDLPNNSRGEVKGSIEKGALEKTKGKEKNNLKTNLIIFSMFLVLIIVWMFLVSKELKNEKEGGNRKL